MSPRRRVRATYQFFDDLDRQLDAERGPNGEPSTADFQTIELLRLVDIFAEGFDELPELIPGRSEYRVLLTAGVLVRALNVVGQLAADGAIELVSIDRHHQSRRPRRKLELTKALQPEPVRP